MCRKLCFNTSLTVREGLLRDGELSEFLKMFLSPFNCERTGNGACTDVLMLMLLVLDQFFMKGGTYMWQRYELRVMLERCAWTATIKQTHKHTPVSSVCMGVCGGHQSERATPSLPEHGLYFSRCELKAVTEWINHTYGIILKQVKSLMWLVCVCVSVSVCLRSDLKDYPDIFCWSWH